MIITADLDLSESGRIGNMTERTTVLIYPAPHHNQSVGWDERVLTAMEAVVNCRLIRDGHVYSMRTHMLMSLENAVNDENVRHTLDERGEVIARRVRSRNRITWDGSGNASYITSNRFSF